MRPKSPVRVRGSGAFKIRFRIFPLGAGERPEAGERPRLRSASGRSRAADRRLLEVGVRGYELTVPSCRWPLWLAAATGLCFFLHRDRLRGASAAGRAGGFRLGIIDTARVGFGGRRATAAAGFLCFAGSPETGVGRLPFREAQAAPHWRRADRPRYRPRRTAPVRSRWPSGRSARGRSFSRQRQSSRVRDATIPCSRAAARCRRNAGSGRSPDREPWRNSSQGSRSRRSSRVMSRSGRWPVATTMRSNGPSALPAFLSSRRR